MRSARNLYASQPVDEENPYWMSFSDIMAGLLVIFVLAAVVLVLELLEKNERIDQAMKEVSKAEEVRRNLLEEIEQELREKNIPVTISENAQVIHIEENVLNFESGKSEIPDQEKYKRNVLQIGLTLAQAINKGDRKKYLDTVFVEGHTDKNPFRGSRDGNWGLSTRRAIAIWRYWDESLPEQYQLDQIVNYENKRMFSVSGYAETRPRGDTLINPDSEDSLRKNRRIDIRFTVKRSTLEQFKTIKMNMH